MATWRFLIFDIDTLEPQAELVAVGDTAPFGEMLNSPGSASVTIPLVPSNAAALTPAMILPPRAIYAVEKDDVILWAGPVITHDYNIANRTVTLACEGFLNYLRRRHLFNTQGFIGTEQTDIAIYLIDYAAAWPGGGPYYDTTGVVPTGVNRDRTYYYYEHNSIGTLIEQLAAVNNGFDFRFVPSWTAGPNSALDIAFEVTYPATGRRTTIVLDLDSNAHVESVQMDATNLAYVAIIEGQGTGEDQHSAIINNEVAINANLRLEAVETHGDVIESSTLVSYAQARLNKGSTPMMVPKVTVSTDMLGEFITGDQVRVRADIGLLQLDDWYRITAWEANPHTERVTLTLAPLGVFTS